MHYQRLSKDADVCWPEGVGSEEELMCPKKDNISTKKIRSYGNYDYLCVGKSGQGRE